MTATIYEIIGNPKFLIQKSLDTGVTNEQLKEVKEYALVSWNNFLEVIGLIKIAQEKMFKPGHFAGYEIAGHGIGFYGDTFSLKDYSYVEEVLTPALQKFSREASPSWGEFKNMLLSSHVSADYPVYLKRAYVPLLIDDLSQSPGDAEILSALKSYMKIHVGIPHLTDIIFEQVATNVDKISPEDRLELLKGDIEAFKADTEKHWKWYFRSIFSFEILFGLLSVPAQDVQNKAEEMFYTWLGAFEEELFDILSISHFDYALTKLLDSWQGRQAITDIVSSLVHNHSDELNSFNRALDPTRNISYILAILFHKYRDSADTLLNEVFRNWENYSSAEYAQKILILALEELASHEQHQNLVNDIMTQYRSHLHEDKLMQVRTELADKYSRSDNLAERDKAYNICKKYLEAGLQDLQALTKEYASLDEGMNQDHGSSIQISGIEGKCLFIAHRLAKDHPKEIYDLSLKYWNDSQSPYLVDMASLPLRQAIVQLLYEERDVYNYQRAREMFVEWAGTGLIKLQVKPYTFLGVWRSVSNIVAVFRPVLSFEEVKTFLKLGAGKEHTHWVLPYYVKYHDDVPSSFKWNENDQVQISKMMHDWLTKPGTEKDLSQLLTDIRNNILKDKSTKEDLEILLELLEGREQRHYHLIDITGHILLDATKKDDKKFLNIVELYYKKWLIPFVVEMPKNVGFVYIPRTKEVLEWFSKNKPEKSKLLKKELQNIPSDWQVRIFEDPALLQG